MTPSEIKFEQVENEKVRCPTNPPFGKNWWVPNKYLPQYDWNIVESGVKHHNHNQTNIMSHLGKLQVLTYHKDFDQE